MTETIDKMRIWNQVCEAPKWALKQIQAGDLKGMTDIKPQWRIKIMTETFGPCGSLWKYEIIDRWIDEVEVPRKKNDELKNVIDACGKAKKYIESIAKEKIDDSKKAIIQTLADSIGYAGSIYGRATVKEKTVTMQINLYHWNIETEGWSDPIPGIGSSKIAMNTQYGLKMIDEAYKMALTDALSVAMKALGVASKVYEGRWDGSKYHEEKPEKPQTKPAAPKKDTPFGAKEALIVKMMAGRKAYLDKLANNGPVNKIHEELAKKVITNINKEAKVPNDLSVSEIKKVIEAFKEHIESLDQPVDEPETNSEAY